MTQYPVTKILLIDDDDDDCYIFREVVKEITSDISVKSISSSAGAMATLERFQPDIIFLDINLPCIDGHTFLKELKNSSYSTVPVVMYSTSSYPKDIERSYKLGAALYFTKTGKLDDLKASLSLILKMQWYQTEQITMQHFKDGRYFPFSLKTDPI